VFLDNGVVKKNLNNWPKS